MTTPALRVETKRKSKKKTSEVCHKKRVQSRKKMSFLAIVAIFIIILQILDRDKG